MGWITLNISWKVGRNELAAARAELTRLEKKELQLLQHLLDVRAALKTQRSKIDVLVRDRSCMISRLPTELLVRIFSYFLSNFLVSVHPRRQLLAGVSRRWRDVILDTPILWECIRVSPSDEPFSLETQSKRSRDARLDVVITDWRRRMDDMQESLDIIIFSADRWRSLTIWGNPAWSTAMIVADIDDVKFLSLQHILVEEFLVHNPCPRFLSSTSSPALEDLSVPKFTAPPGFLPVPTIQAQDSSGGG